MNNSEEFEQLKAEVEDANLVVESLTEELADTYEELTALYESSQKINSWLDLKTLCNEITENIQRILKADWCILRLLDQENQVLIATASSGFPLSKIRHPVLDLSAPICGLAVSNKKDILIEDVQTSTGYPGLAVIFKQSRTLICSLLEAKGEIMGAITMGRSKDNPIFTARDLKIVQSITAQAGIALLNARLYEEAVQKERMGRELEIASQIQKSLLPQSPPEIKGLDIAAICEPALEVGGDYYGFIAYSPHRIGIVIADVMGKGVPAALFTAMAHSVFKAEARDGHSTMKTVDQFNRILFEDLAHSDMFLTMFFAVIDTEEMVIQYTDAAHNLPMLCRGATGELIELETDGVLVGALPDGGYGEESMELHPGDCLVMFTDGVTEHPGPEKEMYGEERLRSGIRKNVNESAARVQEAIMDDLKDFAGGCPPADDITMVVVKIK